MLNAPALLINIKRLVMVYSVLGLLPIIVPSAAWADKASCRQDCFVKRTRCIKNITYDSPAWSVCNTKQLKCIKACDGGR